MYTSIPGGSVHARLTISNLRSEFNIPAWRGLPRTSTIGTKTIRNVNLRGLNRNLVITLPAHAEACREVQL